MTPEKREMSAVFGRLLLLSLPFAALFSVELLLRPLDCFAFRAWEALSVKKPADVLRGPFYPNCRLDKLEEGGDLVHRGLDAVPKAVTFQTDRHGYRAGPEAWSCGSPSVVVVGDSYVVGPGVSQGETLAGVLHRLTGRCFYSFAPNGMNRFALSYREIGPRPEAVVLAVVERNLLALQPLRLPVQTRPAPGRSFRTRPSVQEIHVAADRLLSSSFLGYAHTWGLPAAFARLCRCAEPAAPVPSRPPRMSFLTGGAWSASPQQLEVVAATVASYRDAVQRIGARFVFVPIPEKETVYPELTTSGARGGMLSELLPLLRARGVLTVDLETPYREAFVASGRLSYHLDDTHWNAAGVEVAARLVAEQLR